jgi:hypothetical protein
MHNTPIVGGIWAAVLACLYFITSFRSRSAKKDEKATDPAAGGD